MLLILVNLSAARQRFLFCPAPSFVSFFPPKFKGSAQLQQLLKHWCAWGRVGGGGWDAVELLSALADLQFQLFALNCG